MCWNLKNPLAYDITSIFKPNATLEDVLEDLAKLVTDFSKRYYVIIMGSSNNALNSKKIDVEFLENIKLILRKTNTVWLSVPYWHGQQDLNQFIYKINCLLYNSVSTCEYVNFIDVNSIIINTDYTQHGLHLNGRGKHKIFNHILSFIQHNESWKNNYVVPDGTVSNTSINPSNLIFLNL